MREWIGQPHELPVVRGIGFWSRRRVLWALIVAFAGADVGLTLYGLELCFSELNPLVAMTLENAGAAGLFLMKISALALVAGVCQFVTGRRRLAALLGFCLPQAAAVAINSATILLYTSQCLV
jgi:hypothetical protein